MARTLNLQCSSLFFVCILKRAVSNFEGNSRMNPAVEVLEVAFSTIFAAESNNFCLVKQFYRPAIEQLSAKIIKVSQALNNTSVIFESLLTAPRSQVFNPLKI